MSKTYGQMQGMGKEVVTRRGNNKIWAKLKTWNGSVEVTVFSDETASINVNNLDITLNGNKMFAERRPPSPPGRVEMIKTLRRNLKELFEDARDHTGKTMKDKTHLDSLLPRKYVKEIGPLIKDLEKFQKELKFKLNTLKVVSNMEAKK
jgi:hypothetical protein